MPHPAFESEQEEEKQQTVDLDHQNKLTPANDDSEGQSRIEEHLNRE